MSKEIDQKNIMKQKQINFKFLKSLIKEGNLVELEKIDTQILQQARNILNGETLMHTAAYESNLEIVQFLHNQGLSFDVNSISDLYPLHYATLKCDIPVLKFILAKAPNLVNVKAEDLDTPLHCLARAQHIQGMIYLIRNGGEVNIQNTYDGTPFDILKDEYYPDLEYNENMTKEEAINILEGLLAAESSPEKPQETVEEEADPSEAQYDVPSNIELLSSDHLISRSLEEIEGAYSQLLGDTTNAN